MSLEQLLDILPIAVHDGWLEPIVLAIYGHRLMAPNAHVDRFSLVDLSGRNVEQLIPYMSLERLIDLLPFVLVTNLLKPVVQAIDDLRL